MEKERIPLNNKLMIELLEDSKQPQKTIFSPNADMIKIGKVLSKGKSVDIVKEGDTVHVYTNNLTMFDSRKGFCSQRDLLFVNEYPQEGKVHITEQTTVPMSSFTSGVVIKSSSEDIQDEDKVFYKKGQSHVLPDNTEIISESQIYYSEK